MSTTPQQPSQDASPAQLEPRRAYKPRTTLKSPAIQAKVLMHRGMGTSKAKIAKELGIAVNTVTNVLELNDFDRQLTDGKALCAPLIPKAVEALDKQLSKGDGELGRKFLNDMGVIGERAPGGKQPVQIELSQAIGIMFKQAQPVSGEPAIEVVTAPANEQKPSK